MRKIIASVAFILLVSAAPVLADTDVQAQIAALLQQIAALQQQLAVLQGEIGAHCVDLTYNLGPDDSDANTDGGVSKLQQFLIAQTLLSSSLPHGFFGPLTMQAVQQWQLQKGIVSSGTPDTTGYGFVGPRTRAKMACSATTPPPPASCTINGNSIPSGGTVTAYQSSSVPFGNSCVSQMRTCNNGTLSGSYTNATCAVAQSPAPVSVAPPRITSPVNGETITRRDVRISGTCDPAGGDITVHLDVTSTVIPCTGTFVVWLNHVRDTGNYTLQVNQGSLLHYIVVYFSVEGVPIPPPIIATSCSPDQSAIPATTVTGALITSVNWTVSPGVAVPPSGINGWWDKNTSYGPRLARRADGTPYRDTCGNYCLYYIGTNLSTPTDYDETGLALSKDLVTWNKYWTSAVVPLGASGEPDAGDVQVGSVIYDGGKFHMFYDGNSVPKGEEASDKVTINYATSVDGKAWTKYAGNPIVYRGVGGDSEDLYTPVVIKDGSTWKMWYVGHDASGNLGIMYATAPNPEGPWTKYSNDYVLQENPIIWIDDVWKENGTYHALYSATGVNGSSYASSPNGVNWTKGPLVVPGAHMTSQVKVGNTWHVLYGTNSDVGIKHASGPIVPPATQPPPPSPTAAIVPPHINDPVNGQTISRTDVRISGTCDPAGGDITVWMDITPATMACDGTFAIWLDHVRGRGNFTIQVNQGSLLHYIVVYMDV